MVVSRNTRGKQVSFEDTAHGETMPPQAHTEARLRMTVMVEEAHMSATMTKTSTSDDK